MSFSLMKNCKFQKIVEIEKNLTDEIDLKVL